MKYRFSYFLIELLFFSKMVIEMIAGDTVACIMALAIELDVRDISLWIFWDAYVVDADYTLL